MHSCHLYGPWDLKNNDLENVSIETNLLFMHFMIFMYFGNYLVFTTRYYNEH